jgi:hypothetical protein
LEEECKKVAALIVDKKIVALDEGRAAIESTVFGRRSILTDPSDPGMRKRLGICSEPFRCLVAKFLTVPLAGSPGTPTGKGILLGGGLHLLFLGLLRQMSSNVLIFVWDSGRLAFRNLERIEGQQTK